MNTYHFLSIFLLLPPHTHPTLIMQTFHVPNRALFNSILIWIRFMVPFLPISSYSLSGSMNGTCNSFLFSLFFSRHLLQYKYLIYTASTALKSSLLLCYTHFRSLSYMHNLRYFMVYSVYWSYYNFPFRSYLLSLYILKRRSLLYSLAAQYPSPLILISTFPL